jgi:DNA replication protein DnaC
LHELKSGFSQCADSNYEERWQRFLNIDLLALDDLGTENPTPWVQEHLDTLIDYRLMHKLPTVVTTNLLLEQLTFRIHSRLQRDGLVIGIDARAYCEVRRSVQK